MTKQMEIIETYNLASKQEAEELVQKFKEEKYPVMTDYKITVEDDKVVLEVTKEFYDELDNMKFN